MTTPFVRGKSIIIFLQFSQPWLNYNLINKFYYLNFFLFFLKSFKNKSIVLKTIKYCIFMKQIKCAGAFTEIKTKFYLNEFGVYRNNYFSYMNKIVKNYKNFKIQYLITHLKATTFFLNYFQIIWFTGRFAHILLFFIKNSQKQKLNFLPKSQILNFFNVEKTTNRLLI